MLFRVFILCLTVFMSAPVMAAPEFTGEMSVFERAQDVDAQNITDMTFYASDNTLHSLSQYKGKWVLAGLWATWCAPCVVELPYFDRFYREHSSDQFAVALIAVDGAKSAPELRTFLDEHDAKAIPVFYDRDDSVWEVMDRVMLPATYIIDPQGRLYAQYTGSIDWSGAGVKALIESMGGKMNAHEGQAAVLKP